MAHRTVVTPRNSAKYSADAEFHAALLNNCVQVNKRWLQSCQVTSLVVICPWKWDLGNGTDIPKSGMTARTSTRSEGEDLTFDWSRRDKKPMWLCRGQSQQAGFPWCCLWFSVTAGMYLSSELLLVAGCLERLPAPPQLLLALRFPWRSTRAGREAVSSSKALTAPRCWCHCRDSAQDEIVLSTHPGHTSLPSELCCFFASLCLS